MDEMNEYQVEYIAQLGKDKFEGKIEATLPKEQTPEAEQIIDLSMKIRKQYEFDIVQIISLELHK